MKVMGFEWLNRKALVTGASGFKGSWLSAALLGLGARVFGTVRNQKHPDSAFAALGLDDRVVKVNADVSDRQAVYDMLNAVEPDVVFHLAAKARVPDALRDPHRAFDVNIMGTLNLIEACRKLKVCTRLLVCSTDHVFGNVEPAELPEGGFDERSRVSYSGPYDTSKAAMELMVRSYHYTYWAELPAIGITRCANVFGYGDTNQRRIVPFFLRSAFSDGVIPLRFRKSGRQFIHVTDAVAGYVRAASSLDEGGTATKHGGIRPDTRSPFTATYHFAIEQYADTSEPFIRMEAFATLVSHLFGAKVDDSQCIDYPPNENRVQALRCESTCETLNWVVGRPFRAALRDVGRWYETNTETQRRALLENDVRKAIEAASEVGTGA